MANDYFYTKIHQFFVLINFRSIISLAQVFSFYKFIIRFSIKNMNIDVTNSARHMQVVAVNLDEKKATLN